MLMAMALPLALPAPVLIPLASAALSFSAAAPLRHVMVAAVTVRSSPGERLSRPVFTAEVMRGLFAPAVSAASAQTVATSAAAEASTAPSLLLSPSPLRSSHSDTTPAIAAASWVTDTDACACAECSRSSCGYR
jgi:hypothetical protein